MTKFRSTRILDGKPKHVIVDDAGKIINRNPTKEELLNIEEEYYRINRTKKFTDGELLEFLRKFYRENGRVPIYNDFENNPGYPHADNYVTRFGSWNKGLELAGLWDKRMKRVPLKYADSELLNFLVLFYEKNGRPPSQNDFDNDLTYPSSTIYLIRFGTWQKALKLVGLDVESMIRKGVIKTNQQKARLAELLVINHFTGNPIDLSGENYLSPCDGICPNGKTYDVKSRSIEGRRYIFGSISKYYVEILYLLGFNKDYSKLEHAWRISILDFAEDVEKGYITIGPDSKYNIEDMKEYEITEKINPLFENWLEDIQKDL